MMVMMMMMMMVSGILLQVSLQASAVEMTEGQSILLLCEFPTFDMDQPTVEWSRSDLSPPTVHQRQEKGDELMGQNQLYRGRTSMKADALETGDLSLNLTRLQTSDTGTYSCSVRTVRGNMRIKDEELLVKERFPSWVKALLVLLVLILTVAAGLLYYLRHRLRPETKTEMKMEKVEVDSEEGSVLLPCKMVDQLPRDIKVEWRDERNRTVHVYQNGSDQPGEQDQRYRTRTKMNKKLLKTGDLSLTLRQPTDGDRGKYTCIVSSWRRNTQMMKQVQLEVKAQQVEVESGVESVLLPCRTTVRLPEDVRVEWRDGFDVVIHVYQNGSDQPGDQDQIYRTKMDKDLLKTGDLSLTLEHPADGGIYTCRVYSGEGDILMDDTVQLEVKAQQVEAEQGADSVKMEFRVTSDLQGGDRVEWVDEGFKRVHVYQNGSDQPGDQDPSYRTRTKMEENLLETGDLSLTLMNPTDRDNKKYKCSVLREGKLLRGKQFQLKVKVPVVKVKPGQKFVLLPCRTREDLPEDVRVEWTDGDEDVVHVYENGSDQLEDQNQLYRTRTKMNKDLKTGDVSLTLSWPTDEDRNTYTCRVSSRERDFLMKKQVQLEVKAPEVEVEPGVESVLLPWTITEDLPGDAKVVWMDKDNRKVHVYQDGSDQPEDQAELYKTRTKIDENLLKSKDLSLTLSWPTDEDSNIYICRVYSGNEDILMKKDIQLKVKDHQVEVEEGAESVLLPFRTTPDLQGGARVVWRDRRLRTVHVNLNGSDQPGEQDQVYRTRTKMNQNLLETGDLSLILRDPTERDSGKYGCEVLRDGDLLRAKTVLLNVKVRTVQVQAQDIRTRSSFIDPSPLMADQSV